MTALTPEALAELRRLLDDMRALATREGIYNGNRAVLDIIGRVEPLLDRLAHGQQHAGHPAGGTWCGVTNDPGVADVRPRVPVCADCHIKAMRHRADLLDSTEAALAHMTEARDNDPATASASTATVPEPLIPTHGRTTS